MNWNIKVALVVGVVLMVVIVFFWWMRVTYPPQYVVPGPDFQQGMGISCQDDEVVLETVGLSFQVGDEFDVYLSNGSRTDKTFRLEEDAPLGWNLINATIINGPLERGVGYYIEFSTELGVLKSSFECY